MSVKVYCERHSESHNLTIGELVSLIHIYQYSLAQHAYEEPLPVVTDVSHPVQVLRKALCPLWELETIDPDKHPLSKMRSYVEHMLLHRNQRQRAKSPKFVQKTKVSK